MTAPILVTKLHIPLVRPELVPRPRLIECLGNDLHERLTLISAPAGFGKTTLVSEWIQTLRGATPPITTAWLSLDESDNDASRFLVYFISALQTIDAEIAQGLLGALQSPQPAPIENILISLVNEIAAFPDRIIFVLDDYHLINAQSVHDALSFLLENLPPQMHMVIATREDPLLPLSRLRSRRQLTELRAADLRFTFSEASKFLNQAMGLDLSAEEIASLETRTEGWIVGLQMAALSMQGRQDTSSFIQAFTGSHHFILDYLIEEVLQSQPEHVRNFLLQTSLLDRLCSSLCNGVTGQEDSKAMLETLNRGNLFVVPLDDERQWYRYHHLFSEVLKTRLMEQHADQLANLHRRASEWYEQQNLPSDAIHHALAAEDFERAADLAELAWPAWKESFYSITWLGWVRDLPDDLIRTRPVLCVNFAWAHLNAGELEAAEARILDAECWIDPTNSTQSRSNEMVIVDENQFQELPITLTTARAYHAQAIGDVVSTVKYAKQVLDILPDGDSKYRGDVTALLALAYWASGDIEAAHQTLAGGMVEMKPLDAIIGIFVLAEMKMTLGHLHEAISTCEHALKLAFEHGEPMPIGTEDVYSGISELHRERGDLETAAQDLAKCRELGEKIELPDWQYRYCLAQARLNESLGDLDDALRLLDEAERVFVRTPLPIVRPITAMKARVWIKQGELSKAAVWARQQNLSVNDDLSYLCEFEHITLAKLLIAQNLTADAVELLERLLKAAEEGKRLRSVIEILVLLALAFDSRGDKPGALAHLERALKLAEPEGFFQIFIDEGQAMARLLYDAVSDGIESDHIQDILGAFPTDEPEQPDPVSQIPESEMVEPLSEREIEVLQLIAKGLTNQEIASRLYITLNTVKGHARNIYSKLSVKSRTQAVAKGRVLGILHPK
jgi:LuxR family maltose regulon positive regulatory protein